jgi:hypothetical protein
MLLMRLIHKAGKLHNFRRFTFFKFIQAELNWGTCWDTRRQVGGITGGAIFQYLKGPPRRRHKLFSV